MHALKMAVNHLRNIDRFADAPVGGGIENEILQPEAASLIEAQPQQRGTAVEGVPDKLRAAVCQKGAVAAAAKLDCAGLPGGMVDILHDAGHNKKQTVALLLYQMRLQRLYDLLPVREEQL